MICDDKTKKAIEVKCSKDEMPQIVNVVYHAEKGVPLTSISVNSLSKCYVVSMSITERQIDFGCYETKDGELVKMNVV